MRCPYHLSMCEMKNTKKEHQRNKKNIETNDIWRHRYNATAKKNTPLANGKSKHLCVFRTLRMSEYQNHSIDLAATQTRTKQQFICNKMKIKHIHEYARMKSTNNNTQWESIKSQRIPLMRSALRCLTTACCFQPFGTCVWFGFTIYVCSHSRYLIRLFIQPDLVLSFNPNAQQKKEMRPHKMTNTFITAHSWRYKSERKNYNDAWNECATTFFPLLNRNAHDIFGNDFYLWE